MVLCPPPLHMQSRLVSALDSHVFNCLDIQNDVKTCMLYMTSLTICLSKQSIFVPINMPFFSKLVNDRIITRSNNDIGSNLKSRIVLKPSESLLKQDKSPRSVPTCHMSYRALFAVICSSLQRDLLNLGLFYQEFN